jgi:hypothetical protein
MDPDNPSSKYSRQFAIFKDGRSEYWIKWVMALYEIENLMTLKETVDNSWMFWALLKSQALSYFEHGLRQRVEEEDSEVPDNQLIELVIRYIGLEYIPKRAICMQKYYRRQIGVYI